MTTYYTREYLPAITKAFCRVLLTVALAGAIHAQVTGNPLNCATYVPITLPLRAEGMTEQASDIALICTGGVVAPLNSPLNTVTIQVFFNAAVTSRIFANGWSEALLIVDEPNTGFAGASNTLLACNDPNGLCTITGTGTGVGTYDGTAGRPNVFQGTVTGNSVTFNGIPIDGAAPGRSRVLRITNVRVNATSLSAGSNGPPAPVIASVGISGTVAILVINPTQTVGVVMPPFSFTVRSPDNSSPSAGIALQQCSSNPIRVGVLRFDDPSFTSFKPRTLAPFIDADTSPAPLAQYIPGNHYQDESGFYAPGLTSPNGDFAKIGLAESGTRLRATMYNIPAGTTVYVSTNRVAYANGSPAPDPTGAVARLIQGELGAFAPVTPSGTLEGIPVAALQAVNGTASAVWEVLRGNPNSVETLDFVVWARPTNTGPFGTALVSGSFAPAPPAFIAQSGAAASSTLPEPRFTASSSFPPNLFSIGACSTVGSDFNGDGAADIIWQDPVTGLAQVWLLGGVQPQIVTGAATLTASNSWRIVGVGDFDRDGHPDIVWQDPVSGAAQVWFLGGAQGNVVTGAAVLSTGNAWRIVSVADFNGDGQPDCLWQDPVSGMAQIWFFAGPQGVSLTGAVNLTAGNSWRIVGTGDFDQDGYRDVVWQDPASGATQIWYLGGAQGNVVTGAINLTGSNGWRIVSVADFDADGHPDVVWQDPVSGVSQIWFLGGAKGATVTGAVSLSGTNAWRIAGPR